MPGRPGGGAERLLGKALEEGSVWRRRAIYGLAVALALVVGAGATATWLVGHYRASATDAERRVTEAEVMARHHAGEARRADGSAAAAGRQAMEALRARDNAVARLRATPRPPSATPPPKVEGELRDGLRVRGLSMEVVADLPIPDAEKIWVWSENSSLLPKALLRLEATEGVVEAQEAAIAVIRGEAEALTTARDKWHEAHGAQEARARALQDRVVAIGREARAKEVRWWVRLGGVAVGAYIAGRATR